MATTLASGNPLFISRIASSERPVAGPLMPVPSNPSITSVALRARAGISVSTVQPHARSMR